MWAHIAMWLPASPPRHRPSKARRGVVHRASCQARSAPVCLRPVACRKPWPSTPPGTSCTLQGSYSDRTTVLAQVVAGGGVVVPREGVLPLGARERASGDGAGVSHPGSRTYIPNDALVLMDDRQVASAAKERRGDRVAGCARQRRTDRAAGGDLPQGARAVGGRCRQQAPVGGQVGGEDLWPSVDRAAARSPGGRVERPDATVASAVDERPSVLGEAANGADRHRHCPDQPEVRY